jgi:hypothetical protein
MTSFDPNAVKVAVDSFVQSAKFEGILPPSFLVDLKFCSYHHICSSFFNGKLQMLVSYIWLKLWIGLTFIPKT